MKFSIVSKNKKARTGILITPHGKIKTPNLAIVATHGNIRLLNKVDHKEADPDFLIANTFHLWVRKEVAGIKKAGGIHKWNGIKKPIMTDSGGFQVFSLGWGKVHKIGKVSNLDVGRLSKKISLKDNPVKINDDGVVFEYDGRKHKLNPEKSMRVQQDIGADIIFSFDECTSPLHSYSYNKKSLNLTHRWAERSLSAHKKLQAKKGNHKQMLFGIVQGGIYEDLRKKSSNVIGSMDFDGFGIGGSFGEKQMKKVVGWALSGLPDEKPRHLLGIGKLKDIFVAVEQGVDLFDCVVPTREGRHGTLYTKGEKINIRKSVFADDKKLIERGCGCVMCKKKIKRNELRELFKSCNLKDKLKAQRYATMHNIYFYKTLFQRIREAINKGEGLGNLKKEYLLK